MTFVSVLFEQAGALNAEQLSREKAMKLGCSWCSHDVDAEDSEPSYQGIMRGLCKSCGDRLNSLTSEQFQSYLDGLEAPVLAIELYAGRYMITRAVNRCACARLNKEPQEMVQHLCGNVIECAYARLPAGCGGTTHCADCGVKRSVAGTHETGALASTVWVRPAREVPDQNGVLVITTVKAGHLVLLRMDESASPGR